MIEYLLSFVCIVVSCYMFLHARVSIESGDFIVYTLVYSILSAIFGAFALITFIETYKENKNGKDIKESTAKRTKTKIIKQAKKEESQ